MKYKAIKPIAIFTVVGCLVLAGFFRGDMLERENEQASTGRGTVENLLANYKAWEEGYVKNGGDKNLVLPIGPFRGLSTESSTAHGRAILNLIDGTVSIEVKSLPKGETWDVWLVENRPGSSVVPEAQDTMVRVGDLKPKGDLAKLEVTLGKEAFAAFEPDLIAVTRAGKNPAEERLLVGTTTLFHRLFRSGQRGHFGNLSGIHEPARQTSTRGLWNWLVTTANPTAHAQIGPLPDPQGLELLIQEGRLSFFNDTFNGNGRTCGTCHRENRNLTIDPEFIATLPPNDPLFVAEFHPPLMCLDPLNNIGCNFENPVLMRRFGLICENADGFDKPCVFRGVPHTLALISNTLEPAPSFGPGLPPFDGTTVPPVERTGWDGGGAPVGVVIGSEVSSGRLRDFIIGAIIQHYPKTLARTVGEDFTLPTVGQLNALEAFQRSLGRQQDLDLDTLILKSPLAERGKRIFNNSGVDPEDPTLPAGKCALCHRNAGASINGVHNANFNTNVEGLPGQPARLVVANIPIDGGFGNATPCPTGGFGNCTFNTPVVVEAADTGPFFHNNSITTIEGAVAFYNSASFNMPPGVGASPFIGGIKLEPTEVEAVAAFLRVINALENLESTQSLLSRAKKATNSAQLKELLNLALSELNDSYKVLSGGGLHPETLPKYHQIISLVEAAMKTPGKKIGLINQALVLYGQVYQDLRN